MDCESVTVHHYVWMLTSKYLVWPNHTNVGFLNHLSKYNLHPCDTLTPDFHAPSLKEDGNFAIA